MPVVQIIIDDSTSKIITGNYEFNRDGGGVLCIPCSASFPVSPVAGEMIWRTDQGVLYRRNSGNTEWEPARAILADTGNPNGVVTGYLGQLFRDTSNSVTYVCTSSPSGTAWDIV